MNCFSRRRDSEFLAIHQFLGPSLACYLRLRKDFFFSVLGDLGFLAAPQDKLVERNLGRWSVSF